MLNRFIPAVAVGFALLLGAAPADAASKEEIKEQKGRVKMMSKELKSFNKLKDKWMKAKEKGKDTGKIDAALVEITKRNLGWLRGTHKITPETEKTDDNKWHVEFLQALKTVKHETDAGKKTKALGKVSNDLATRLKRHENKLKKMGG